MPRNDKAIPKKNEKLVYQQANSRCSFCPEGNVSLLELHHIVPRAEGGSNDPQNLLLVCKNCHGLIEAGDISLEKVLKKKQSLGAIIHQMPKRDEGKGNNVNISGSVNSSIVANNLTINNGSKSTKIEYPKGSIGAHLDKKNYIQHLVKRYYDFRKADNSYGAKRPFHHGVIHKNIESKFKAKTYFIPEEKFEDLATYLKGRINATIQGTRNKSNGTKNYSTFEEYIDELYN
ncbi:MAG: HNH endonuclease [Candidatus Paceibacterota bacterium]